MERSSSSIDFSKSLSFVLGEYSFAIWTSLEKSCSLSFSLRKLAASHERHGASGVQPSRWSTRKIGISASSSSGTLLRTITFLYIVVKYKNIGNERIF